MTEIMSDPDIRRLKILATYDPVTVVIKIADLVDPSEKWTFIILGRYLDATIEDMDFLQKVITGKINFSSGYMLKCDLREKTSIDIEDDIIVSEFIIPKVYSVKDRWGGVMYKFDDKAPDKFVDSPVKTTIATILKLFK